MTIQLRYILNSVVSNHIILINGIKRTEINVQFYPISLAKISKVVLILASISEAALEWELKNVSSLQDGEL